MKKKNPGLLEAIFGAESFFKNVSDEHKNVLLNANLNSRLVCDLYHHVNERKVILAPESLEIVLKSIQKLSSGKPFHNRFTYFELASDPEQDYSIYHFLDVVFKTYDYRIRTCLAIAGYQQREAKKSVGLGQNALEVIKIGAKYTRKDYITMENFIVFMYAYGAGFPTDFINEELKGKSTTLIRKLLLEYEMQLTGVDNKHQTLMNYKTAGDLRDGFKIIHPLFE